MKKQLNFSFDDEVVSEFRYNPDNKLIAVHFTGYSDLLSNERLLDNNCILTIKNWKNAKGMIHGECDYTTLEKSLRIFSMVLSIELLEGWLVLEVNSIDGNYIKLMFLNPELLFVHE